MFISAFICLAVPLLIAAVMIIKRRGKWYMLLLGIVSFTVSQLLLRIPILGELQNTAWFTLFALTQKILYLLILALSAGVFEEAGRYAALRFLNKDLLTWENGVLFGLGHGGVEAFWLAGLPYIDAIAASLSGESTAAILSTPPAYFLAGGLERALAVALHIGLTMLVFYAVKRRNICFFILAIVFHAVVDALAVFLPYVWGIQDIWVIEGVVAVFAALALIITFKLRNALGAAAGKDVT